MTLGQIIDHEQIDFTDGGYIDWDDIDWEQDTVHYFQYTGLDDKNGTEVYEDDLYRAEGQLYRVVFTSGWAGQEVVDGMFDGEDFDNMAFHYRMSQVPIIGNYHKNKELLNAQD